jgi:hypothetical protein
MSHRLSKPVLIVGLVCLACLALVSSGLSIRAEAVSLHVRFAHFATGVQPVDLYANGNLVVKNLKYKDVSDYLALDTLEADFVAAPAGGKITDSLTEKAVHLMFPQAPDAYFTVALIGSVKDQTFELVVLPADRAPQIGSAVSGPIAVSGAWVRATAAQMSGPATPDSGSMNMGGMAATQPAGSMNMGGTGAVSAAYMLIKNAGNQADQLIGVSCDSAATAETHQTTVVNDVAQMVHVAAIDVPANGSVELKPGSYHIMLMQLKHDLVAGQTVTLTLAFKSGVTVTVIAPVKAP